MERHDYPPRLAAMLLGWLLKDEWQTPLGDFEEYYHELARERGTRRARWWYRVQVLRLLPDRLIQKTLWNTVMLKNYIVLAYRNLLKNKAASAVNIFGLSVAVGCAVVAYLFAYGQLNNEAMHEQGEHIYLVGHTAEIKQERLAFGTTPAPLGPAMEANFPQVVRAVRVQDWGATIRHGDTEFNEWIRFADPGFFDMFTFPLKYGDADALTDPEAVILSDARATRYFGDENPLGRTLAVSIGGQEERLFTVRGVAEPHSRRTSAGFSMLMAYEHRFDQTLEEPSDWSVSTGATFIQVQDPDDIEALAGRMASYIVQQNAAVEDGRIEAFTFENLYTLARNSDDVRSTIAGAVAWAPMIILSIMAVFLLVLSCVNYMNIALASANRRLKEIGIRKVVGSNKAQLVGQYLTENLVLCALALVVGIGLAHVFLVPAFTEISGNELGLHTTAPLDLWLFLGGLLAGVALVSGAYPALYISSFQPVVIFRGNSKAGGRNLFMQSFLTVQFVLAFLTMIACVGLLLNARSQQDRDWGYDQDHTLVIPVSNQEQYSVLHNEALQLPNVRSVSGSQDHIGHAYRWLGLSVEGEEFGAVVFRVAPTYPETMGLRLKTGQFFEEGLLSDATEAIVINETFVRDQDWEEPVGQAVRIDTTTYTVIGVVEDFHYASFSDQIGPVVFRLADESAYRYLSARIAPGGGIQTAEALETVWDRLQPDTPAQFFFQDSIFDRDFQETRGIVRVFLFVAVLALLISCMGLFGLSAQNTARRMKEIGVRKVLGASLVHLARVVNLRFVMLLVLAALVATPVGYMLLNALLDSIYAYRMEVGPLAFVIAYAVVFVTGLLTLSSQVYQLAAANPADLLRDE